MFFSEPGKNIITFFFKLDTNSINNTYLSSLFQISEYLSGFILTLLFLYLLGLIVSNVVGKKIYKFFELLLQKIPIVSKIYNIIKNITDTISKPDSQSFQKVVVLEYPRKGLFTLAMVTGECKNEQNESFYNLFVPTTPNPTSGYLIFVKKEDIKETDFSVDDALSIIISGGMITSKDFKI